MDPMSNLKTGDVLAGGAGSLPVAVLISGGGTTLKNLLDRTRADQCPVDVRLVISSKENAGGLRFAEEAGIKTQVIAKKQCASSEEHRDQVFALCREANVQYVVMGGYLEHLLIAQDFENRVINIHPSLIPAFSGKGYYGLRVHQAVLDYGARVTGCTVHFVDDEFDHGPIIDQRVCLVEQNDTAESLQQRVFQQECELLPSVLKRFAESRVEVRGRKVVLTPLSSSDSP